MLKRFSKVSHISISAKYFFLAKEYWLHQSLVFKMYFVFGFAFSIYPYMYYYKRGNNYAEWSIFIKCFITHFVNVFRVTCKPLLAGHCTVIKINKHILAADLYML